MKKLIMLIGIGLLLSILGGVGGALIVAKMVVPSGNVEEVKEEEKKPEPVVKKDPIYFEMHPPFVVNVISGNRTKFLQVDVVVMTYEQDAVASIEKHMPAVRNNLLMFFGKQDAEELQKVEGKEKMRSGALQAVREVMTKQTGKPLVEDIYFTKMVIQ